MKTHENRALFSKAVLKATTCLFLAAGASVSPAFAFPEKMGTNDIEVVQQQAVTITGVIFCRHLRRFFRTLCTLILSRLYILLLIRKIRCSRSITKGKE